MEDLKAKLQGKIQISEQVDADLVENENIFINNSDQIILEGTGSDSKGLSIVPEVALTINEAKLRLNSLQEFVKEMMILNQDYGIIPGCSKPSLYKSGAEKLCDVFGFSKQIDVLNRLEDWQSGLFHYEIKATLVNKRTGLTEAEGIGCCNSKEKKFKGQDAFSSVNSILKMAKKRALVDAVLSATRSSGMFTQDVEDMDTGTFVEGNNQKGGFKGETDAETEKNVVPAFSNNTCKGSGEPERYDKTKISLNGGKFATPKQLTLIYSIANDKKLQTSYMKQLMENKFGVGESKELSRKQASDLIEYLLEYTA